jgi:hypothetical protein
MLYYYHNQGDNMKNYVNTIFTIKDLMNSATPQALKNYKELISGLKIIEKYTNPIITNGRVNHYWFQSILTALSDGQLVEGGQGNSDPDMFWNKKTIEIKGCTTEELDNLAPIRVGASKYFASNGGIKQLKDSDQTLSEMKKIIFKDSYHDDYYMLTETCGLESLSQIENVRIIFVSTEMLIENLISNLGPHTQDLHHQWVTPSGLNKKKKINWPFLEVNTKELVRSLL